MTLYTVQPITDFTIFTTPALKRKGIPFKASWSTTLDQLAHELDHLDATDVVLELDVQPGRIRRDGMLYADAKVGHPGVRLSFQTRDHGALSYTCDTYESNWIGDIPDWQANVRAIVLTLQSLRAVDRYGATKGEQYAGFKELPAGTGATALGGMTKDQAARILSEWSGVTVDARESIQSLQARHRSARAAAHPDRHAGSRVHWDNVEQAAKVLGL